MPQKLKEEEEEGCRSTVISYFAPVSHSSVCNRTG